LFSHAYFGTELHTGALLVEIMLAGLVVVASGWRLSILADRIADAYHLGGAWIGLLLLATVTSLPEVVTGCTAAWIGQPDLAFSAIFGSCSFNIVIIVMLNLCVGGGSILAGRGAAHALSSAFGIVLIAIAMLAMLLVEKFNARPETAQFIEWASAALIAATYLLCMRMVYRNQGEMPLPDQDDRNATEESGLLPKVALVSLVLVAAAWWLAKTGDVLADHPIEWLGRPLGATFVGALFLAIATSLPEIVTGLAAVRLGNLDMALGNIFGSNMFNICVIPALKVSSALSGRPLLMHDRNFHLDQNLIAAALPILLTAVVVGAFSYHRPRAFLKRMGADSALIAAIYVGGMALLLIS